MKLHFTYLVIIILIFSISCSKKEGCTNVNAINYDPEAKKDDGSCTYPVYGCVNPSAINYNPNATHDDGTCVLDSSNNNSTNQAPEITNVSISNQTPNPGDTIELSASINDDLNLASINVSIKENTGGMEILSENYNVSGTFYALNYSFKIPSSAEDGDAYTLIVTAEDENGLSTSESTTITVENNSTVGSITTYTNVTLGAQTNPSLGGNYAVVDNAVYTSVLAESNSGLIDFLYYYGNTYGATIVAPDDETVNGGGGNFSFCANWSTKNATRFKVVDNIDFDTTNDDSQLTAITDINATKIVQLFVEGNPIAFKLSNGKLGLLRINQINGTGEGSITFDIKIQE